MLTVILVGFVKPGIEEQFEARISKLFKSVASEPGCRGVTWGRTEKPGEYALIERYADQGALDAHRASAHMKEQGPGISELFSGLPVVARFSERCPLVATQKLLA